MNMNVKKSIANIKIILSIVLVAILFLMFSAPMQIAFAAETVSASNILDDLSSDPKFRVENYPSNQKDYSLQIITIAESKDDELLLYVYQPATRQDFRASYISMSVVAEGIEPNIYSLTYCNHSGTLYKYKVNDFKVSSDDVRYYEIYSIFRPFVKGIDDDVEFDNTINAVSFAVSKVWEIGEENGQSYIDWDDVDVIEVTDKFVGFVRYENGLVWGFPGFIKDMDACDSHFVAFSTNMPIDKLEEAKIYFVEQEWSRQISPTNYTYYESTFGTPTESKVEISEDDDTVHYIGEGLFAGSYEWERIQTIQEFKDSVDFTQNVYSSSLINVNVETKITDEAKEALYEQQWVLRFKETPYDVVYHPTMSGSIGPGGGYNVATSTKISNVTILRLKFESNGKPYNLGVIDNMQTGSDDPINVTDTIIELSETLKMVLGIMALILLGVIVVVICTVVKPLGNFLKFIGKLIWSIISAPFRFIAWLFGGSKKRSKSYKKRGRR